MDFPPASVEMASLQANLQSARQRIAQACQAAKRPVDAVRIIAVTKTFPIEVARKACAAGLLNIGENRVQEATAKFADGRLRQDFPDVQLHLIGHLQSNKAKRAVELFDSVDSVDSIHLAEALNRYAAESGKTLRCLLEVNTSGELQKAGVAPDETLSLAEQVLKFSHLQISGLMTVGPNVDDRVAVRSSFRQLRLSFEDIQNRLNPPNWSVLSMGMSGDFDLAIAEGTTEIRLGTLLFGQRSS